MSRPIAHDEADEDHIMLRPRPKVRAFELSSSAPSSTPPTPSDTSLPPNLQLSSASPDGTSTPSRTRSILNLTSSTLFGIYQSTGYGTDREEATTPWGTGAETPVDSPKASFDFTRPNLRDNLEKRAPPANGNVKRRRSTTTTITAHRRPRKGFKRYFIPLAARLFTMFGIGVLYGVLISHLHDKREIAPVKVEGVNRQSGFYLVSWGIAGVLLGEALPWLDKVWAHEGDDDDEFIEESDEPTQRRSGPGSGDWLDVVRAIGAFVGVAFAIRKTPWNSTLQLSLTLALANPALWYLLDRSPAGFVLATAVAVAGTGVLIGINPAMMPSPAARNHPLATMSRNNLFGSNGSSAALPSDGLVLGVLSQDTLGVATWIASVLFVSSVCFGNIGRRLVPQDAWA